MSFLKSILLIIFGAIAVLFLNVLTSILVVVFYSYVIDPGHDQDYYQAFAENSAPYSSIIAGMPIMFAVCYWIAGKFSKGFRLYAALLIWLVYFLIDLSVVAAVGQLSSIAVLFALSFTTKFVAASAAGFLAKGKGA